MTEVTTEKNTLLEPLAPVDPELEAMMKSGVHMGHAKSKNHPSMAPFIFGIRNTISIIDLTATKEKLAKAIAFIKDVVGRGGLILLVGTKPAARGVIAEIGQKTKMPYFTERWIGGTLTNFKEIARRVEYLERLEKERASGDFEKYTKKERMKKEEEIQRLKKFFDGIRTLKRLPDAVCVIDITHDDTAVREARRKGIPIVALVDTNSNASLVDWPIPSNDDALPAIRYMMGKIGEAIEEGSRLVTTKASPSVAAKEENA